MAMAPSRKTALRVVESQHFRSGNEQVNTAGLFHSVSASDYIFDVVLLL